MGVLFQEGALFSDFDAFENVAFPLREHTDLPEQLLRTVVLMKLHAVGLRGAARLMPAELSGGMARRIALARAMALDPHILLCDEPFVGLDPISTGAVLRLLKTLNEALGMTTVVVSHDVAAVEAIADTTYRGEWGHCGLRQADGAAREQLAARAPIHERTRPGGRGLSLSGAGLS